jgi:hypothetical protein
VIVAILGIIMWMIVRAVYDRDRAQPRQPINYSMIVALLLWALLLPFMIFWVRDLRGGNPAALPKLACGLVALLPWPTVQLVARPLGLIRTSYYLSFLCLVRFREDRRGAAALTATRTLMAVPPRTPAAEQAARRFIERRRKKLKQVRGAAVVAMGLLTAQRGETDAARALIEGAWDLDPAACPRWAIGQAGEWLLVEAVAEGDWKKVSELAARIELDTALCGFLRACAARFVHTEASPLQPPGPLTLYWRWLRVPQAPACWPLLQRALRSQPLPASEPAAAAAEATTADLPAALRELAQLILVPRSALNEDLLLRVCRSWEAALHSPQTERQIAERALAIGCTSPASARDELRAQVAAVVASRLREAGLPIGRLREEAGAVGAAAAQGVRSELLEQIEQAGQALHDRTLDKRALPIEDEWVEWATLRAHYQRVCNLGGMAVRRLAWTTLHREACNFAVWLWNERKEKVLGNAIFRFLLAEAEDLGDDTRIALDRKNVDCGI